MGVTATRDEVGDSDAFGGQRGLRQQAQPGGELLGGDAGDVLPIEQDAALGVGQDAGDRAEQRRLAARVRPDDGGVSAGGDSDADVSNIFVPVETMPSWMQTFVSWNPVGQLVDAVRGLMMDGPVSEPLMFTLIWMAAFVIVFAPLSLIAYNRRA